MPVYCAKCGIRLVDGARSSLCGFTKCIQLARESILADRVPVIPSKAR